MSPLYVYSIVKQLKYVKTVENCTNHNQKQESTIFIIPLFPKPALLRLRPKPAARK
jgi:hypothetical protein